MRRLVLLGFRTGSTSTGTSDVLFEMLVDKSCFPTRLAFGSDFRDINFYAYVAPGGSPGTLCVVPSMCTL
jgi:hypothetical protein